MDTLDPSFSPPDSETPSPALFQYLNSKTFFSVPATKTLTSSTYGMMFREGYSRPPPTASSALLQYLNGLSRTGRRRRQLSHRRQRSNVCFKKNLFVFVRLEKKNKRCSTFLSPRLSRGYRESSAVTISSILNSSEFGVVEMSDHTSSLPATAVALSPVTWTRSRIPVLFYEGIVGSSRMLDFPPSVGV